MSDTTEYPDRLPTIRTLSDDDILSNAIRFALAKSPKDEKGAITDFQKYKSTFYKCVEWLRDNYQPACDGFLGEVESSNE